MINEVRRQFREDPGIMAGTSKPDYARCVAIVTAHSGVDYDALVDEAQLVVDFRNATGASGSRSDKVWKL